MLVTIGDKLRLSEHWETVYGQQPKGYLNKLSQKIVRATDPQTVRELIQPLSLADARTLLNELRKKRKQRQVVADGLISYYETVATSNVASGVLHAVCHHGDQGNLLFFLRVIGDLANRPPTYNESQAIRVARCVESL